MATERLNKGVTKLIVNRRSMDTEKKWQERKMEEVSRRQITNR